MHKYIYIYIIRKKRKKGPCGEKKKRKGEVCKGNVLTFHLDLDLDLDLHHSLRSYVPSRISILHLFPILPPIYIYIYLYKITLLF